MSHHLVTVCMFCLLCAAHTNCSERLGVDSGQDTSPRDLNFTEITRWPSARIGDLKDIALGKISVADYKSKWHSPGDSEDEGYASDSKPASGSVTQSERRLQAKDFNRRMRYLERLNRVRSQTSKGDDSSIQEFELPTDALTERLRSEHPAAVGNVFSGKEKYINDENVITSVNNDEINQMTGTSDLIVNNSNEVSRKRFTRDVDHDNVTNKRFTRDVDHDNITNKRFTRDVDHDNVTNKRIERDVDHDNVTNKRIERDVDHDNVTNKRYTRDVDHDNVTNKRYTRDVDHDNVTNKRYTRDVDHDNVTNNRYIRDVDHDNVTNNRYTRDVDHDNINNRLDRDIEVTDQRLRSKRAQVRNHEPQTESHSNSLPNLTHTPSNEDHTHSHNEFLENANGFKSKKSTPENKASEGTDSIDTSTFTRKIFEMFGDPDTMTMDIAGFEEMLSKLNLKKMIASREIEPKVTKGSSALANAATADLMGENKVQCVDIVDLVGGANRDSNKQIRATNSSHSKIDRAAFDSICPALLYQQMAQNSHDKQGCTEDLHDHSGHSHGVEIVPGPQNMATVWLYTGLSIFIISACGLLGVIVIPIMHKSYYNHLLQFLVALAVGTLCGDALLHLMPHAMSPVEHEHGNGDHSSALVEYDHNDGMWKGLTAMAGVVFFYFMEKGLTVVAEWRKRRQKLNKENKLPSKVRVMMEHKSDGCSGKKAIGNSSSTSLFDKLFKNSKSGQNADPMTKLCKHKYSEYPYCYDEIATDTKDDHHVREGGHNSLKMNNDRGKAGNTVSVVSSNALNQSEQKTTDAKPKDWLLVNFTEENEKSGNRVNSMNSGDASQALEQQNIELNNIGKKRAGIKDDNDVAAKARLLSSGRSHSIDRGTETDDMLPEKESKGESYTVILREHSQAHHGHSHSHGHVHSAPNSFSSVCWMVIMGDGLHNFTDGMAIGAAFSSNIAGGFSTALAVLCHELPHELGDFAVLLKAGMSARRAAAYNALSSLLCLMGAVLGVCAGGAPGTTRWIFAAAAGMFLYIALVDMMPELSTSHSKEGTLCQCILQFLGLATGVGLMLVIALYEQHLLNLFQ